MCTTYRTAARRNEGHDVCVCLQQCLCQATKRTVRLSRYRTDASKNVSLPRRLLVAVRFLQDISSYACCVHMLRCLEYVRYFSRAGGGFTTRLPTPVSPRQLRLANLFVLHSRPLHNFAPCLKAVFLSTSTQPFVFYDAKTRNTAAEHILRTVVFTWFSSLGAFFSPNLRTVFLFTARCLLSV